MKFGSCCLVRRVKLYPPHRKWRAHGKRKAVKLLSAVIQSGCVLTVSVSCKGEGVTNLTFSASGLAE